VAASTASDLKDRRFMVWGVGFRIQGIGYRV